MSPQINSSQIFKIASGFDFAHARGRVANVTAGDTTLCTVKVLPTGDSLSRLALHNVSPATATCNTSA